MKQQASKQAGTHLQLQAQALAVVYVQEHGQLEGAGDRRPELKRHGAACAGLQAATARPHLKQPPFRNQVSHALLLGLRPPRLHPILQLHAVRVVERVQLPGNRQRRGITNLHVYDTWRPALRVRADLHGEGPHGGARRLGGKRATVLRGPQAQLVCGYLGAEVVVEVVEAEQLPQQRLRDTLAEHVRDLQRWEGDVGG